MVAYEPWNICASENIKKPSLHYSTYLVYSLGTNIIVYSVAWLYSKSDYLSGSLIIDSK